jgi:hypothetical protein
MGPGDIGGCETMRLPHFLDNELIDGNKVVILMSSLLFSPRKVPSANFCCPQGHNAAGGIGSIEKSDDLIRNWTYDLPAHSTVLQPPTLLHGSNYNYVVKWVYSNEREMALKKEVLA